MVRKCRYISPILNCLSTGNGSAQCLSEDFHKKCEHRHFADRRIGIPEEQKEETKKRRMDV
jgi:hypothetical protein